MIALRDPVTYENLNLSLEDALRQLMLSSMVMYKIDNGVICSGFTK